MAWVALFLMGQIQLPRTWRRHKQQAEASREEDPAGGDLELREGAHVPVRVNLPRAPQRALGHGEQRADFGAT